MSKYNAKRCEIDGFTFDSLMEGARYRELKLLEKFGWISNLSVHPRFALCAITHADHPGRGQWTVGQYEPDFTYQEKGELVVEDVKGVKTAMYRWKKKHFEIQYGIKIREITKKRARAA